MNVLIVHAHPEIKSFNGALTRVAVETLMDLGHEVHVTDLYQMEFEAESDRRNFVTVANSDRYDQQAEEAFAAEHHGFVGGIQREIDRLRAADLVIWQFPIWWFGPPAILKGYIDRVLAYRVFYGSGVNYDTHVLSGRKGLLAPTVGVVEEGNEQMVTDALNPLVRTMRFVDLNVIEPHVTHGVAAHLMTPERAEAAFAAYRDRLITEVSE